MVGDNCVCSAVQIFCTFNFNCISSRTSYVCTHIVKKIRKINMTTAGTAFGPTTALTEKTIYSNVVDARTKLSTVHVPTEGRWLLVSPEIYGLLLKSPEFIKASDLGDAVVQTGAVGRIAGFTVFEDSTLGENVEYIAGHPNWFAFIDEWAVPVYVQDLNGSSKYIGASAVKGRKVYAFKVTKPQTILIKKKA